MTSGPSTCDEGAGAEAVGSVHSDVVEADQGVTEHLGAHGSGVHGCGFEAHGCGFGVHGHDLGAHVHETASHAHGSATMPPTAPGDLAQPDVVVLGLPGYLAAELTAGPVLGLGRQQPSWGQDPVITEPRAGAHLRSLAEGGSVAVEPVTPGGPGVDVARDAHGARDVHAAPGAPAYHDALIEWADGPFGGQAHDVG